jgi:hypothetical protein
MAQQPMYPGFVNSPQTELVEAIDDTQTTIEVTDASNLPDGPNLATIGSDETAETIRYDEIIGNELTGVERGFQGASKAWGAGSKVARQYTAYDHDAARENIADIDGRVAAQMADFEEHVDNTTTAHGVNTRLPISGGVMTGKLTVPEIELENRMVIKSTVVVFSGSVNDKLDIEVPGGFYGSIDVIVTSNFGTNNATGSLTKRMEVGFSQAGAITANEAVYTNAGLRVSSYFTISDLSWDSSKSKGVIKVSRLVGTGPQSVSIIVILYAPSATVANIARNTTFSSVYSSDTTVFPAAYDIKNFIFRGTGSPEGVVTASVGTLYLRLDGSTSTTLYVKTSGTGNTGWTAK